MSRHIHRYHLGLHVGTRLVLHKETTILSVAYQPRSGIVVYVAEGEHAIGNEDDATFDFFAATTGDAVPDDYQFIQAIQYEGRRGPVTRHVFFRKS